MSLARRSSSRPSQGGGSSTAPAPTRRCDDEERRRSRAPPASATSGSEGMRWARGGGGAPHGFIRCLDGAAGGGFALGSAVAAMVVRPRARAAAAEAQPQREKQRQAWPPGRRAAGSPSNVEAEAEAAAARNEGRETVRGVVGSSSLRRRVLLRGQGRAGQGQANKRGRRHGTAGVAEGREVCGTVGWWCVRRTGGTSGNSARQQDTRVGGSRSAAWFRGDSERA